MGRLLRSLALGVLTTGILVGLSFLDAYIMPYIANQITLPNHTMVIPPPTLKYPFGNHPLANMIFLITAGVLILTLIFSLIEEETNASP